MTVKDIVVNPITSRQARDFVRANHYSGKVVDNSTLHIGVFYNGKLEGAMQFGSPMDKSKVLPLVANTGWNEMLELNRMAFSDVLPRNSESRALGIVFRMMRKKAQHIKWILSFADATQCGDGTIYRASGFVLTQIKENTQLYKFPMPDDMDDKPLLDAGVTADEISVLREWLKYNQKNSTPFVHVMTIEANMYDGGSSVQKIMRRLTGGKTRAKTLFNLMGGVPAVGYQLRYIYFLDPTARERLTCPIIPFDELKNRGISMYRGEKK